MSLCDMSSRQACTNPKHRTSTPVLDPFLRRDFLFLQKPGGFDALMLTMKASSLENIVARCTNHYKTHTHTHTKNIPRNFADVYAASISGGSSTHRSTPSQKGSNLFPGKEEYPHLGPGSYHQASRIFCAREEAIRRLPGSRKPPPCFLNSGRSKVVLRTASARWYRWLTRATESMLLFRRANTAVATGEQTILPRFG